MANLQISLANVNDLNAASKQYFHPQKITSFRELAEYTTRSAWSPILWYKGRRCIANYERCQFLVLDYDQGKPTIKDMITTMRRAGLMYFIGTTKSHQKVKTKPSGKTEAACDRFRLVVALKNEFNPEPLRFKWQMVLMMRRWPIADASCKDQGRFFFPCREIVEIENGKPLELPDAPPVDKLRERLNKRTIRNIKVERQGGLPKWVDDFINHGVYGSSRRNTCFSVPAELARYGWKLNEVKNVVLSAPFSRAGLSEHDINDLNRQIENGYKAGSIGS